MFRLFTDHPQSVDETYGEHFLVASGFAGRLLLAAVICAVHAVLPFMFEKTGSRMIAGLYQRTGPGRVRTAPLDGTPDAA
jgi:hypothetical protein